LQTSERGSAVAEFLLLVVPLIVCVSSTVQVSWAGYTKTQLRLEAAYAAFEAGQPDTELQNLIHKVSADLVARVNSKSVPIIKNQNGLSSVEIRIPTWNALGFLNVFAPSMVVTSHAASEI
jgi:hypothetical protein